MKDFRFSEEEKNKGRSNIRSRYRDEKQTLNPYGFKYWKALRQRYDGHKLALRFAAIAARQRINS